MLTLPTMSLPPTRYQTRAQTPRIPEHKIHDSVTYHELEFLGKGSFGRVSRALDLQWGGIIAVKITNVEREKEKETMETLKREVELLAKLSHVSLPNYLLYLGH
jgi:serine/threonine protein kinase